MGMAKRMLEQRDDQGWDYTDKFVCTACVNDDALAEAIAIASTDEDVCSYCNASPAASLDALMERFVDGLRHEYNGVDAEGIPWESREGGYQYFAGRGYDSWDLVELFDYLFVADGLMEDVQKSILPANWVQRDYVWRRRDAVLRDAWSAFNEAVKYKTRYVFWLVDDVDEDAMRGWGEVPPGKILHDIGALLESFGVVKTLDAGTKLWRAQTHAGPELKPNARAGRLGTGKREHSKQPNRMSPAGIPMFYGARDYETAVAEVTVHVSPDNDHVTAGQFSLSSPITIVDFTALPPVPSMFDPKLGAFWREIAFLHEFERSLNQPIAPDDQAIDYVPTQVLTEFLLRIYRPASHEPVVGIAYRSAPRPGGVSLVLDIPNERCVDDAPNPPAEPMLVLDKESRITAPLPASGL